MPKTKKAAALSIPDQVRMAIIFSVPIVNGKPGDIADDDDLKAKYRFDAHTYQALCVNLQNLLDDNNCTNELKCSDVTACKTVGDVIDLITKTMTPP